MKNVQLPESYIFYSQIDNIYEGDTPNCSDSYEVLISLICTPVSHLDTLLVKGFL